MLDDKNSGVNLLDFSLNFYSAKFASPPTENAFQSEQFDRQRYVLAAIAAVILLIDVSSFLIDWVRGNSELGNMTLVAMRASAIVGGIVFIWQSLVFKSTKLFAATLELYIVLILGIMLATIFLHGDYEFIAPITLICVIFALYILSPILWFRQIIYALICTAFGVFAIQIQHESGFDFARFAQWLVFAHTTGMLVSWQRQISQRRIFRQRIELERSHESEKQGRVHHQALVDLLSHELPDGHVKFLHPWPPQIPPGRTPEL